MKDHVDDDSSKKKIQSEAKIRDMTTITSNKLTKKGKYVKVSFQQMSISLLAGQTLTRKLLLGLSCQTWL